MALSAAEQREIVTSNLHKQGPRGLKKLSEHARLP